MGKLALGNRILADRIGHELVERNEQQIFEGASEWIRKRNRSAAR